jgi:hypothetical protein
VLGGSLREAGRCAAAAVPLKATLLFEKFFLRKFSAFGMAPARPYDVLVMIRNGRR